MDLKKIDNKIWFQLYVNLCIGLCISLASYVHVPLNSVKEYFVYAIHFVLLQITLYGFTFFLSWNKWVFKIGFSVLFLVLSFISFWIYTLDITISVDLFQLSLESKPDIYMDLISTPLILFLLLVFLVIYSIQVLYSKINWNHKKRYWGLLFSILAVGLFFFLEQKKLGVFKRRMPYIAIFEAKEYFNKKTIKFHKVDKLLVAKNKLNIVFVLGESVRAKNMQLNGYHRQTNPLLSKRNNLYSLKNVYTPNTYTAKSVPQILTSQSVDNKINNKLYSLYTVLNKANYNTVWIGNQTPELSYRDLIQENKQIHLIDVEHSVLSYNKKMDGELLDLFKKKYLKNKANFYTIHMIGSHWWYESRYPKEFQKFKPVVKTKYLPSNTKEEMINSYDNTIVYLDYFLDNLISFLEKQEEEVILIYLSDHGEVLGEDGKWLHAQNHNASKNPASLIWYSKPFEDKYKFKLKDLKANTEGKITTDFLYPSILDLIDVQSFKYKTNKSIFNINP